jgi:hypothetical protein
MSDRNERVMRRGGGVALLLALAAGSAVTAQQRAGGPPQPPQTPQAAAPIDLTGYWVSVVTEDWRWRMVTPPKGDVASVPLNPAGIKVANAWDPATDGSCLAYGAAGLMRIPTRLHITWDGDSALKIETDAGQQTRRFVFDKNAAAPATRSSQGYSVAEWEIVGGRGGRGGGGGGGGGGGAAAAAAPAPRFGNLKVTTTNLAAGWLRKNGVPYSENTTLTEYYDRFAAPNGDEWLVVNTIVSDPMYLTQDFVTSTHFKKEANAGKWSPSACKPAR